MGSEAERACGLALACQVMSKGESSSFNEAGVMSPATMSLGRATTALCGAGWVLFIVHGCRMDNCVIYVVKDVVWGSARLI